MTQVESLGALERRITLTIPRTTIASEVQTRLRKLARTVRMDGFRPGKVPLSIVAQRYGYSVEYEVMQDKVGDAFSSAVRESQLRVAGVPNFSQRTEGVGEDQLAFDATFEIYPEVTIGDLSQFEVHKLVTEVSEAAVDKTVDILRKQRRVFYVRGADPGPKVQAPAGLAVEVGDRVTLDFVGRIDGEAFTGGSATDAVILVGEKQLLPQFEAGILGMVPGETREFEVDFPADYPGAEVAGKKAVFTATVKKVEWAHLPQVDAQFAKALGVKDGSIEQLRADIRDNLQREVKFRLIARNKQAALDVLAQAAQLEVPKALVASEVERMVEAAREDLKSRGVKDAANAPIPAEIFSEQAARRVKLGLAVAELVKQQGLQATPEQIRAHIEELAQSYEKPADVVTWYYGKRERLAEVEAVTIENNVADFIMKTAKVVEKPVAFDEVMTA